ncbi:MAG: geranylgeranyl reductase family protein, partial [Bacteroidota bacterium]
MRTSVNFFILGAGPGGVAAALQLSNLGIPCTLVDKAIFPRDKICGDAISGKVVSVFNKIDEQIFRDFYYKEEIKADSFGINFFFPQELNIELYYSAKSKVRVEETNKKVPDGFVAKRIDFDNFLVDFVRKRENIDFLEGVKITEIEQIEQGFLLKNDEKELEIHAKLVIAADGAQSKFARQIGKIKKEDRHYAGAVRAYYKNVKGINADNFIELHYVKELYPGYLWIFPLPDNQANVGLGMRTDKLSARKVNMNKELIRILNEHPRFKGRFSEAELTDKIRGFGLPFGSKKRKISGDHYMLIGDAASLIDPLTGEGIGNAAISGQYAALQAQACLENDNFSAQFMSNYDQKIYKRLWKELKISRNLQTLLDYPWLVQPIIKIIAKNKRFSEILSSMFTDIDLRKKLRNPMFYVRLLLNR